MRCGRLIVCWSCWSCHNDVSIVLCRDSLCSQRATHPSYVDAGLCVMCIDAAMRWRLHALPCVNIAAQYFVFAPNNGCLVCSFSLEFQKATLMYSCFLRKLFKPAKTERENARPWGAHMRGIGRLQCKKFRFTLRIYQRAFFPPPNLDCCVPSVHLLELFLREACGACVRRRRGELSSCARLELSPAPAPGASASL